MLPEIVSKGFIYKYLDCEIHFTFDQSNSVYAIIKNQFFYHGRVYSVEEVNTQDLMFDACFQLYKELQQQILIQKKSCLL